MELSKATLEGLGLVTAGNFDDAAFKTLVTTAFAVAVGDAKAAAAEEKLTAQCTGASGLVTKQAYTSVLTVVLEGAKHNSPASELSGGLEESKWSDDRIRYFVALYDKSKAGIRAALEQQSSFPFPAVTGVSWRMDYYMRSNVLEKVKTQTYLLTLHTQTNAGVAQDVKLSLSLEEMHDLLQKCKDMAKQSERAIALTAAAK